MEENPLYFTLQFDGASEPNPGFSGVGWVLLDPNGIVILEGSKYIGFATNNQAEYLALTHGLQNAHELGIQNLHIQGDSLLVVNQVNGLWKVKDIKLGNLHTIVKEKLKVFQSYTLKHIPRHLNSHADLLSKEAILKGESKV